MKIIIARHGNTFKKNQPVVWVGSQNDISLVDSGVEQAKLLGQTLAHLKFIPNAVYSGPLQRMTTYAHILLQEMQLNLTPIVDFRLNEIDYGQWSGLTTAEVCEKFGMHEFERWEKFSEWPEKGGWGESAHLVSERIHRFASDLIKNHSPHEKILIVGSNGCLRYFLDLIPDELRSDINNQGLKIATGNISKITHENAMWKLIFWNTHPSQIKY